MWCTSRARRSRRTRPTCVRVFSRMRWWCTAGDGEQRRDRRPLGVGPSRSESIEDVAAVGDGVARPAARIVARAPVQAVPPAATRVEPARPRRLEARDVAVVVDVRRAWPARRCRGSGRAARPAGTTPAPGRAGCPRGRCVAAERRDELLADGVERRVGDLREQLLEVVEQQREPVPTARRSGCRCPSSRSARAPVRAIGASSSPQLLVRVAERSAGAATHATRAGARASRGRAGRRGATMPCVEPLARRAARSASSRLISSSPTMRPWSVSTRNMRPGCRRPFCDDVGRGRRRSRRPR